MGDDTVVLAWSRLGNMFVKNMSRYSASLSLRMTTGVIHALTMPLRLILLVVTYITRPVWGYNSVWHPTLGILRKRLSLT